MRARRPQAKIMHALGALTEIDITALAARIACMILPNATGRSSARPLVAQTEIMQAFPMVLEIHKGFEPYASPA
jgi:hypothetical protein